MSDSKTSMDAAYVTKQRYRLGVAYMMAMGVCGIVLVAIGSNLKQLASNCNTSATKLGTVFIARGVGAIFGAICSAKLYRWFRGNRVMILVLFILSALVLLLPMVSDIYTMHVVFCLLGICTAITDTGCQIQTRKVHGINAGPWLGCNTITFSLSGALVPLIGVITSSLFAQCSILAGVVMISIILVCIPKPPEALPAPKAAFAPRHRMLPKKNSSEDVPKLTVTSTKDAKDAGVVKNAEGDANRDGRSEENGYGGETTSAAVRKNRDVEQDDGSIQMNGKLLEKGQRKSCPYVVEFLAAWEAFWLIGGKVAATSYLTTYVDETGVIAPNKATILIVALWIGISLGRLVGIFDQIRLSTERLYLHVYIQLWLGAIGMALVVAFPMSGPSLWTGVIVYGFFNGPTIGYIYDLCNRTTKASEKGMSIIMFGLNIGASLVPFLVSFTWENGAGPMTLPTTIMLSHLFPIPSQWFIRLCTAVPGTVVTARVAKDILISMCSFQSVFRGGSDAAVRSSYHLDSGIDTPDLEETQSLIAASSPSSSSSSSSSSSVTSI